MRKARSLHQQNCKHVWFTLSPIIMEVENGRIWKVTTIGGVHFSLPWLWEEGYKSPETNIESLWKSGKGRRKWKDRFSNWKSEEGFLGFACDMRGKSEPNIFSQMVVCSWWCTMLQSKKITEIKHIQEMPVIYTLTWVITFYNQSWSLQVGINEVDTYQIYNENGMDAIPFSVSK